MKSIAQLLDQRVRQIARQKVRDAIQPGVIGNVLESEINAVLSQIVNARLVQQRDAALDRAHYEHGGDGRLRNGFKPVSLGGLFGNWSILKPVLRRGSPAYPLLGLLKRSGRNVLGFLLVDRVSTDAWSALLKDYLARGLDRKILQLAISDDHKAIRAAVEQELAVPHQLCVVHKMRNARLHVTPRDRRAFLDDFKAAYWAESKDLALVALGRLQARWEKHYPAATRTALADADRFLRFMDQPRALWTTLRSSNLIERFNGELRRRLRSAGALPGENSLWKLVWSVSVEQEKRWSRRRVGGAAKLSKHAPHQALAA